METDNLEYICRLVFETCRVPITFFDNKKEIVIEYPQPSIHNPIISHKKDGLLQLLPTDATADFPLISTTNYFENYLILNLLTGYLFVGPCLYKEITEDLISGIINDNNISNGYKNDFISYYQKLPILNQIKFIHTGMLIYFIIFQKKLDIGDVVQKNSYLEKTFDIQKRIGADLSINRQNIALHQDPALENIYLDAIREGRIDALSEYAKITSTQGIGTLSKKSQLRNEKNLAICGIALFTRASIEGGLQPELAYTMSDLYIQKIEDTSAVSEINNISTKALIDFCDRVRHRKQHLYSNPVLTCKDYIFNHIYEKLAIADLASMVHHNPAYLSRLFKKEVGITLGDYIQREKIEEAKKLLKESTHSIPEICSLLNFTDQSYFIKVFKKFTGTTPKQFKRNKP